MGPDERRSLTRFVFAPAPTRHHLDVEDATPAVTPDDPFRQSARELEQRIQAWSEAAADDRYAAQAKVLGRATQEFIYAVRAAIVAFSRYPSANEWLLPRFVDDILESSIAIMTLAREGVFNVGRRELRYLLEAVVKHVYVDQQLPGETALRERLEFLNDPTKVPRSSVAPVDDVVLRMVGPSEEFTAAVHSAFGHLSGYTHLSKRQLDERLQRAERGEFIGFESAETLDAFNRLLVQTYDVILALVFEGVGPSFTGDLFVQLLDDEQRWRFRRTKFVSRVSQHFDYKAERQSRRERST